MKKVWLFLFGLLIGFALGVIAYKYNKHNAQSDVDATVQTITYDTLYCRIPVPYDSAVVRYVDKYVEVSQTVVDSIIVRSGDSIPVTIPITQKEYRDSTYEAWVSGYDVKLDSIRVFGKTITNTEYRTIQVAKAKRWGIGVQVGYGYGTKGFTPYVGVGIHYNIFSW